MDSIPVPDLSPLDSQYIEQNSNLVAFPDGDRLQDSIAFANSQWPDFTGPDLADVWDILPSQCRFDDFIVVPESLTLPEQGEDATGGESNARRRCRIPPDAKRLLEESFERHKQDPYLQKNDIKELAQATNLSLRQIRTFFANARARKLPPPPSLSNVESGLGDTDEAKSAQTPGLEFMIKPIVASRGQPAAAKKRRCFRDQESQKLLASANIHVPRQTTPPQQDPMERFLSSSPEDEGISEDAIRKAAASLDSNEITKRPSNERRSSSRADAMSVTDTAFSSNSGSASSHASIDSVTNRGPRKGRKRQRNSTLQEARPFIRKPSHPYKVFQCTFCSTDFAQKYDWRRHEESVHFPQQEWICMPDGPTIQSDTGTSNCAFCGLLNPSPAHFDSHNCSSCLPIPRSSRTFTRKDKLLQHLTQVHKQALFLPHIGDWCRPIQRDVAIACGICGLRLQTWSARADHISAHFVDGHSMDLWVGAPGGITPSSALPEAHSLSAQGLALDNPASSPTAECQHHPCSHCAARFTRYVDAVFHERQAHAVYRPRPTAPDRDDVMPKPSAAQRGGTGLREEYPTILGVQIRRRAKGPEPRLKPGGPADVEAGSLGLEGFKPVPRGGGKGGGGEGGKGRLAALVAGEGGTADEAAAAFAPASVVPASFVGARRAKLAGDVRPDLMTANGAPKPSRMALPGSDGLTPSQQPLWGARSKTVWGPWGLS